MTLLEADSCIKWLCERFPNWRPRDCGSWAKMLDKYEVQAFQYAVNKLYPIMARLPARPDRDLVGRELKNRERFISKMTARNEVKRHDRRVDEQNAEADAFIKQFNDQRLLQWKAEILASGKICRSVNEPLPLRGRTWADLFFRFYAVSSNCN